MWSNSLVIYLLRYDSRVRHRGTPLGFPAYQVGHLYTTAHLATLWTRVCILVAIIATAAHSRG